MQNTVYRSNLDSWLLTVFRVTTAFSLVAIAAVFYAGASHAALVSIPILIAGVVLPWWILLTTDYTVTNLSIEVRSGPFHWSIPFRDITRLELTRDATSSPALSLDRLRIQYSAGARIMISPESREKFIADLRSRGVNVPVQR